jgi:chaperonin GroES
MADKVATPIGDRVLLKEVEQQTDRTAGGIIIPDSAKLEDVKRAEVIKVGPGIYTQNGVLIPMTVEEGNEVILPPYHQGQEVKINGEKYTLLRESEILMVLK